MRKITKEAILAFRDRRNWSKDNTQVKTELVDGHRITELFLFGNKIASLVNYDGFGFALLSITNAGWESNTTKERLNGLPGVSIHQSKGQWFLNGSLWDGKWITIGDWETLVKGDDYFKSEMSQ